MYISCIYHWLGPIRSIMNLSFYHLWHFHKKFIYQPLAVQVMQLFEVSTRLLQFDGPVEASFQVEASFVEESCKANTVIATCVWNAYEKPAKVLMKEYLWEALFCLESGSKPWKAIWWTTESDTLQYLEIQLVHLCLLWLWHCSYILCNTIYTCTHARVSWMRIRYPALVAQLQISSNFHVRNLVIYVACFWVKQCTCRREFCINPQHDQHGSHHFWLITSLWLQMAEILERGFHCRAIFFGARKEQENPLLALLWIVGF